MRYFILREHSDLARQLHINGWRNQINPQWICFEELYRIPHHTILSVENKKETPLPDVITAPFLMVSEMVYKIMKMYGEGLYYRDVILGDEEKYHHYYLILLKNAEKEKKAVESASIFYKRIENKQEVVVNLDFAESILRRGAVGIWLKEIHNTSGHKIT